MPIYEYICQACNAQLELLVKSSSTKPSCPKCGSKKLERQLSTFAAHNGQTKPCTGSTCPGGAMGGGGCSGGSCPFSLA